MSAIMSFASGTVAGIFTLACRMGFIAHHYQASVFLITGPDPFSASPDFATRYNKSDMPSDIGGELTTGTDGHCCLGVEQHVLCDEESLWARYSKLSGFS